MAKTDNLTDFLTDLADTIRAKKGTTEPINPQNFSEEISNLAGGGGGEYNIESVLNDDGTQTLNITHKDYVPPQYDRVFANNTPEQIALVSQEIAQKGLTSAQVLDVYGWKIGDVQDITLTSGEEISVRIIGVNHDDLSDGSGKAGLTLQMVDCLAANYSMNNSNTNSSGYKESVMRKSTLNTIKSTLPQEWQSVIKSVNKKSADGGASNYVTMETTVENIFLLSEIELTGSVSYAQNGSQEGSQYEYWSGKEQADRIKKSNGKNYGWYLRSCSKANTISFVSVTDAGAIEGGQIATNRRGVSFAFCI